MKPTTNSIQLSNRARAELSLCICFFGSTRWFKRERVQELVLRACLSLTESDRIQGHTQSAHCLLLHPLTAPVCWTQSTQRRVTIMHSFSLPNAGAASVMIEYSISHCQLTQLTTSTDAQSLGPILDGMSHQHSATKANLTSTHTPAPLGRRSIGTCRFNFRSHWTPSWKELRADTTALEQPVRQRR